MQTRTQVMLWAAQRVSAMVLALCVLVHLATMIYAVRNGLTAGEILGRTRGNPGWGAFYLVFVASVAIHGPIGLRAVIGETLGWRGRGVDLALGVFGVLLAFLGARAVYAVLTG